MGDVEPDHRHVEPGVEDALCRFRISPDVELGRRGHVPLGDGAAHQDDAPRPKAAVERLRDVRQRPDRHEHGVGRHVVDEEVDGALLDRLGSAGRKLGAVEAALTVNVGSDLEFAHERPFGAGGDRHVGVVDEREQPERVVRRLVEGLIAVRRRDADELDLGAREREQERDRIVVAGIAVEDVPESSLLEYAVDLVGRR